MAKIVSRGDPIEPVYLNNLRVAAHGWGVVSGLAVSERGAGANMSVDVAAGVAWINELSVVKGAVTNVVITAAHASYDRYDLVVINSSGTISVISGTAAATSYANDYDLETNNAILLAEVYVPATDTTIENAQITDKQILSIIEEIEDYIFSIGLEEYSNHLGATDNFTETNTVGNGAATADTTNHEMDLVSGITAVGLASFKSKDSWTPTVKAMIFNGKIDNIVTGAGGHRYLKAGFDSDWGAGSLTDKAVFIYDSTDGWETETQNGSRTTNSISALSNGDILTIVLTTSYAKFYVNGVLVQTHITNLPPGALEIGMVVGSYLGGAATTSISLSADMIGVKVYH